MNTRKAPPNRRSTALRLITAGALVGALGIAVGPTATAAGHPAGCLPLLTCDDTDPLDDLLGGDTSGGDSLDDVVDDVVDVVDDVLGDDVDLDTDVLPNTGSGTVIGVDASVDGPGDLDLDADAGVDVDLTSNGSGVDGVVGIDADVDAADSVKATIGATADASVDLDDPSVRVDLDGDTTADARVGDLTVADVDGSLCGIDVVVNTTASSNCAGNGSSGGGTSGALIDTDGLLDVCGAGVAVLGATSSDCTDRHQADDTDGGLLGISETTTSARPFLKSP